MTYEINPISANVVIDKILDIRPATYNKNGSYELPEDFRTRYFVRQIGLSPRNDRAYIFLQPSGVYIPGFGYGPITGRITRREQDVELHGDYAKFPDLPRTKTIYLREITEDGVPHIKRRMFDTIEAAVTKQESVDVLLENPVFSEAITTVFEKIGFAASLPAVAYP